MSSPAIAALLRLDAPGEGSVLVATAASTVATALPTNAIKIWLKAPATAHVRFGDADVGAATLTDQYLSPDQDYALDIPRGVTHWRAIRGADEAADVNIHYVAR